MKLVGIGVALWFLIQIVLMYVLIPFVIVKVLGLFGITIGFWLAIGICWVFFFTMQLVKRI